MQYPGYKPDDRGIGVGFPEGETNLYLYHIVQSGPGDQPATCAVGTVYYLAKGEAAEA